MKSTFFSRWNNRSLRRVGDRKRPPKVSVHERVHDSHGFYLTGGSIDTRDICCVLKEYVLQVTNVTVAISFTSNETELKKFHISVADAEGNAITSDVEDTGLFDDDDEGDDYNE